MRQQRERRASIVEWLIVAVIGVAVAIFVVTVIVKRVTGQP
ncbi:MAG TPA: hypothetical protein VHX59_17365 [Mycobacteriales bacterium]|nr:hypothetical protein [Mycobacteriales bacterium]